MHWTPIDGTTLLHLAIDFDDEDIFKLLLAHGADANARANMDVSGSEGFGGHTPMWSKWKLWITIESIISKLNIALVFPASTLKPRPVASAH